jgi:hypothetical protein
MSTNLANLLDNSNKFGPKAESRISPSGSQASKLPKLASSKLHTSDPTN